MKARHLQTPPQRFACWFAGLSILLAGGATTVAQPADPGWPREFKQGSQVLTVYQPQVDFWHGYTNLHFRSAISIKGVLKEEKFGVTEVDALTVTDHGARVVAIVPLKREVRFAGVAEPELTQLRQAVERLRPMGEVTTLSLDRVVAYLDPQKQPVQRTTDLNLEPPKIFSSTTPAILVIFMGPPRFVPVETNRTDLLFALNTNWDVLQDAASQQYFLLHGAGWLTTTDLLRGPWIPATKLPPSIYSLPDNPNWAEARKRLPGRPANAAPVVFATTEPGELLLTAGPPAYATIAGTKLLRVTNTESVLFLHVGDGKLYFLAAGRWFRAGGLSGPWTAASADLPADFAQIPATDPAAWVMASVPGTREAQDAVLLASIPTTTTVNVTNTVNVNVTYSGAPQFVTITNTVVQYAVNTPKQVFLVSGRYYCCDQGVWFESAAPTGPWSLCSTVPSAIYTIPPSNPNYNVTYVVVQSSTPTTVVYSQTSGYSGEYVAKTGVLMFGVGMLVGAAIANNNDCDYCYYPPPPCHYAYGCGATYHYGHGGYYGASYKAYGPYGGASYTAGYNPSTGTYARSASAYGPYGSATRSAAYNPYTGSYAGGAQVSTAYGSAGRYGSYNASSGTYSAGAYRSSAYGTASAERSYNSQTGVSTANRQASTDYGSASRSAAYDADTGARAAGGTATTSQGTASRGAAYNPTTGEGAAARSASGQYGSAGSVKTTSGSSAAAWDTQSGQGAVGKTSSGEYYASNGDTVYKKDSDGNWSQNSGSGWESTESPQQQAQTQASSKQQQAQSQASSAQSQAQTKSSTAQTQANTRQQQTPTQASTSSSTASSRQAQAQASTSSASSSWSQQKSSMESQAQARQAGNQQAARTSQYQNSGTSSRSSAYSGRSSGGRSGGGRR